jgi:hypothetical protein
LYSFACFISYKRPPKVVRPPGLLPQREVKHLWMQFAEAFEETLAQFLNTRIPIFRDDYLWPGSAYPAELSSRLCKSVCMVALVVPEYFESKWCRAEWDAMRAFEEDRLGPGKHGLLIPVLCVGDPVALEPLFGTRLHFDLRNIVSPAKQLSTVRNRTTIQNIANIINHHAKTPLPPKKIDCETFSLGIEPEEISPKFSEPSPFR